LAEEVPLVSEAEAKLYYDQNPNLMQVGEKLRAAHILLEVPGNATPQARAETRARATEIRGRILAGEDFAKLAARYSADTATAAKGGQLDPFARGHVSKAFEDVAFAMTPGELSDVVETPLGFHLIRLYGRIPGVVPSFDQVKETLRQQLSMAPRQEHIQAFINKLKAKAKIETFL
jgi:parvulin-like peptidyl-prolyl isomerase